MKHCLVWLMAFLMLTLGGCGNSAGTNASASVSATGGALVVPAALETNESSKTDGVALIYVSILDADPENMQNLSTTIGVNNYEAEFALTPERLIRELETWMGYSFGTTTVHYTDAIEVTFQEDSPLFSSEPPPFTLAPEDPDAPAMTGGAGYQRMLLSSIYLTLSENFDGLPVRLYREDRKPLVLEGIPIAEDGAFTGQ